jgi:tRNA G46 methylase TrmB
VSGDSRRVDSPQDGPHAGLTERVRRHLAAPWRRPVAAHTHAAFEDFLAWRRRRGGPWVLDAGCGTGASAHFLAERLPGTDVLGIDKSAHRLARAPDGDPDRVRLLRADLVDFWRLLADAPERPRAQYLLYPNPWPKAGHLGRRWHGHPVFPAIVAVGGELELRSNWRTYVEEFAAALALVGVAGRIDTLDAPGPEGPVSPFERKYLASGQSCHRLGADLGAARVPATGPSPDARAPGGM